MYDFKKGKEEAIPHAFMCQTNVECRHYSTKVLKNGHEKSSLWFSGQK
jgi:hypothetical protein